MTQIEQSTADAAAEQNPNGSGLSVIPDDPRIKQALQLYAQGMGLRPIGQELGVSHETVRLWLLDELGPEYATLQRQALIRRIGEADEKLDLADNAIDIARAREQCKFARWDAERRLPQLFGIRQQITHEIGPDLGEALREARKRVADTTHAAVLTPPVIDSTSERID